LGLKPDHWIRKMALEQGMIEPFVEKQVRDGVVSYGVSSYGYDIRVADEFKIFTANPYNTVVDPKHLDERSLIPFKGDVCIIPPNSFALAVTVEYFRIPRDVLTLTVGKSTYARCFRGDTRVALVDGTTPTLEDMARRAENGGMFWGYSVGGGGQVIVAQLESPRFIGRDSLLELILDNGLPIRCTPDHLIMMREGHMIEAGSLRPGDPLKTLGVHQTPTQRVRRIRELPGDHDVYCLTVPETGNFALEAGVFVHNCGIITNVTPFEPGWEGFVTLEISNTTPLPARIYANEGIAQVLFFEADEPCEVSYADRKGKYNKQTGITLPKV